MNDMAYATGAHPDYNPQMAESIVLRRCTYVGFHKHGPLLESRKSYGAYWTDTKGTKHGQVWEFTDRFLLHEARGKGDYPLLCASTQAGCIWVWLRPDGTVYGQLQAECSDSGR